MHLVHNIEEAAKQAYDYAKSINGPYPEGEDAIIKSAQYSFLYAACVLKLPYEEFLLWEDA